MSTAMETNIGFSRLHVESNCLNYLLCRTVNYEYVIININVQIIINYDCKQIKSGRLLCVNAATLIIVNTKR